MKFVIIRSEWLCGIDALEVTRRNASALYHYDSNKSDCLGHVLTQAHVNMSRKELVGQVLPSGYLNHLDHEHLFVKSGFIHDCWVKLGFMDDYADVHVDSRFTNDIIGINDNENLSNDKREKELIRLFVKNSHTLKFIN